MALPPGACVLAVTGEKIALVVGLVKRKSRDCGCWKVAGLKFGLGLLFRRSGLLRSQEWLWYWSAEFVRAPWKCGF